MRKPNYKRKNRSSRHYGMNSNDLLKFHCLFIHKDLAKILSALLNSNPKAVATHFFSKCLEHASNKDDSLLLSFIKGDFLSKKTHSLSDEKFVIALKKNRQKINLHVKVIFLHVRNQEPIMLMNISTADSTAASFSNMNNNDFFYFSIKDLQDEIFFNSVLK